MTSTPTAIDTGKVPNCRKLRFNTIDDALAEVDRLVAAEREGRLQLAGNWTLGQILGHLATWMEYAHGGYPKQVQPPFFVRWFFKSRKRKYIHEGMPRGVKIPRIEGGTLGREAVSTNDGARRFRAAFETLRRSAPTTMNPLFGKLSHDEWIQLELRHAELHLGFCAC